MAEYYAVERSPEYLAHYGIKGMRWGVRRAKEKGNLAKLTSHYERALRKKDILRQRTSRKGQKEDAKAYAGGAGLLLGTGALAGLAGYGLAKGQVAAQKALMPNSKSYMIMHPVGLYGTAGLAGLGGLASLGASAASAYRSTKRGNKSAVKKYKAFSSEMSKQFDKKTIKNINRYLDEHPDENFDMPYINDLRKKKHK